jgi:hypothetical protein
MDDHDLPALSEFAARHADVLCAEDVDGVKVLYDPFCDINEHCAPSCAAHAGDQEHSVTESRLARIAPSQVALAW